MGAPPRSETEDLCKVGFWGRPAALFGSATLRFFVIEDVVPVVSRPSNGRLPVGWRRLSRKRLRRPTPDKWYDERVASHDMLATDGTRLRIVVAATAEIQESDRLRHKEAIQQPYAAIVGVPKCPSQYGGRLAHFFCMASAGKDLSPHRHHAYFDLTIKLHR